MKIRSLILVATVAILSILATRPADAQAFTEFRDPLRGVTFYSVQIATDPLMSLQHEGGSFSSSDEMTLGLSAFFFDESDTIDDYVLWLRHDGPRRWFTGSRLLPLEIIIDDTTRTPPPLHTLGAKADEIGPFVEKLEFTLHPGELEALFDADTVTLHLNTLLGSLDKTLSREEKEAMRRFRDRANTVHAEAQLSSLSN